MALPTDASGTMKYWFRGLPLTGVNRVAVNTGNMGHWFGGVPSVYIFSGITSSTRLMMMGMGT